MENRFEDVVQDVLDLMREVRAEHFPNLRTAKILVLFDLKKRRSNGKMVLGRIQRTNDLLRYLTQLQAAEEGYDYIIYLDKVCWNVVSDGDQTRIMRHELRHILHDIESERTPWKLIPHDIEDFAEEIELNRDDINWRSRVVGLTQEIYRVQEEESRE